MTWDDFMQLVEAGEIIGGDLETMEDGVRNFLSRISGVTKKDDFVSITCAWTVLRLPDGRWEQVPTGGVGFNMGQSKPRSVGAGCIELQIPYLGEALIRPREKEPRSLEDVLATEPKRPEDENLWWVLVDRLKIPLEEVQAMTPETRRKLSRFVAEKGRVFDPCP
jgi:hypothetical protein